MRLMLVVEGARRRSGLNQKLLPLYKQTCVELVNQSSAKIHPYADKIKLFAGEVAQPLISLICDFEITRQSAYRTCSCSVNSLLIKLHVICLPYDGLLSMHNTLWLCVLLHKNDIIRNFVVIAHPNE